MSQLAANPFKVSIGDTLPFTVTKGSTKVRHIEFSGYTAGAGPAIVTDINGVEICKLTPSSATDVEEKRTANIGYVTGIIVTSCGGAAAGDVLIYFE
jgi:hypothetical protein